MRGYAFVLLILSSVALPASGQTLLSSLGLNLCKDSLYCPTGVVQMGKAKGIEFNYERLTPFGIRLTPNNGGVQEQFGRITRNRRLGAKLKLPVCNLPGFKAAIGFSYFQEYFRFGSYGSAETGLFSSLDQRSLKRTSAQLYLVKPFRGNVYLGGRFSVGVNGDYERLRFSANKHNLQFSGSLVLVQRPDRWTERGLGVAYSWSLGRPGLYPVFIYNKTFNRNWGIEAVLPAKFNIRRNLGPGSIMYLGARVDGGAYHLHLDAPTFAGRENLQLRKSEIRGGFSYHQEIVDPIWINFNLGFRRNINLTLVEGGNRSRDAIMNGRLRDALYFDVGFYVVPPKKFYEKKAHN